MPKAISTVIASILMLMIVVGLGGTAYLFISGTFTSKTATAFEVIDEVNGTVTIRNSGAESITRITASLGGSSTDIIVALDNQKIINTYNNAEPSIISATCGSSNTFGTEPNCPADDTNNAQKATSEDNIHALYDAASAGSKTYTHIFDYNNLYLMNNEVTTGSSQPQSLGSPHNGNLFEFFGSTDCVTYFSLGSHRGGNGMSGSGLQFGGNTVSFSEKPIKCIKVQVSSSCNGCVPEDNVDIFKFSSSSALPKLLCNTGSNYWLCNKDSCGSNIGECTLPNIPSGRLATIKPLSLLTKGTHTLRLCTSSMCNTAILTII